MSVDASIRGKHAFVRTLVLAGGLSGCWAPTPIVPGAQDPPALLSADRGAILHDAGLRDREARAG